MSKMMYVLRERFARGVTGNPEADKIVVKWLDDYIAKHSNQTEKVVIVQNDKC